MSTPIKAAVLTGGHGFDVMSFHQAFREIPGIDFYIQNIEDFVDDSRRKEYDAIVFYNMHTETPEAEQGHSAARTRKALEQLSTSVQGLVFLHHGILAYPQWELWNRLVGIPDRTLSKYIHDVDLFIEIADAAHPITKGLNAWEMIDETYLMNDAGKGCEVLLTVNHPESMRTVAWTNTHGNSRIVCFQCGHDPSSYNNENFRTIVERSVKWAAGKL